MIKAIAPSEQNGLTHTLCKTVLPMIDAPARPGNQSWTVASPVAHSGSANLRDWLPTRPPPWGLPLESEALWILHAPVKIVMMDQACSGLSVQNFITASSAKHLAKRSLKRSLK